MSDPTRFDRFLEPVYLNEQMVLNCAAYLFKGVPLQSESGETKDSSRSLGMTLGIPFLQEFLATPKLEVGIKSGSTQESRMAHRYTAGGLHMAVLDELRQKKMIQTASPDKLPSSPGMGDAYVDFHAVLRPSDYYALIGTMKIMGPLVAQAFRDFGEHFLPAGRSEFFDTAKLRTSVDGYEQSIMSLIDKLERDYLTSNQLEMVMWSKEGAGVPVGIVDLDVTDYEPNELRSKLSGGKYHVIGKVVGKVATGESLDLMQKTVLSNTATLLNQILSLQDDQEKKEQFQSQITVMKKFVEQFVRLEIAGPAVRIAAMSVCI